jgi:hypothetical protein
MIDAVDPSVTVVSNSYSYSIECYYDDTLNGLAATTANTNVTPQRQDHSTINNNGMFL